MESFLKTRLLICADWFDPGFRAGGPIRSCVNLTELLGDEFRVAVITSDSDLGAAEPYVGITADRWRNWRGKARVRYCGSVCRRMVQFVVTMQRWQPEAVYLNSMFSVAGTIWPLLWTLISRSGARIVLAPRGMLKESALSQKGWKKRPILLALRWLGIVRRVTFHATSDAEVKEIRSAFGDVEIVWISNVPCLPLSHLPPHSKDQRALQLCFVGRVHPIKNLLWLLQAMSALDCRCHLTVVGPIEDHGYFSACQETVERLPPGISVEFAGAKTEGEVRAILLFSDAMVLPTLGENFGHAIFESLAVGTPVIISDQTIWRELQQQQAGWDLPLVPELFASAISELAGMAPDQYAEFRQGALSLAQHFQTSSNFLTDYRRLFSPAPEDRNGSQQSGGLLT
jgi:glycosyltransferase involved in cell wall biosynthesis